MSASKHVLVMAAGAADDAVESLDGRTPLEAAVTPALDEIARLGRQGTVRTIPRGFAPSRDVATLALLGYDVRRHYSGYAGLEAAAHRLRLTDEQVVFRCNIVTVADRVMVDPTAGGLDPDEAAAIIAALNEAVGDDHVRFHAGLSYRHLMITDYPWAPGVACTPAHEIIGEPLARHWPSGRGGRELRDLMLRAGEVLSQHEINRRREAAGRPPANAIWLWGQGVLPRVRRFRERFGLRGAAVGAVDLIRGAAVLLGWPAAAAPGATGGTDTDYSAKGRAALDALDEYDLVVVHVEAPDEASHAGDLAAKIAALERIDRGIVAPLLDRLRRRERWSILFAPDLAAHVDRRTHGAEPVPICLAGSAPLRMADPLPFAERHAARGDLHIKHGWELMEYFLRT
jgi:2,3-bisphosphoglycerate-independent phosphoglycerate mutase